jgi:hypothetical protein
VGKPKVHHGLDRAVDRGYWSESFPSDRHRVECIFAFKEKLTGPMIVAARPTREGQRMQMTP